MTPLDWWWLLFFPFGPNSECDPENWSEYHPGCNARVQQSA